MIFSDLGIIKPILDALIAEGYTTPTPIQQRAIPHILKGKDLIGCAQTGTGKTAAFAIPILQLLNEVSPSKGHRKPIKALILTPTRELAIQIEDSFNTYGKNVPLKKLVVFGGVNQNPQVNALKKGIDVLVATPGRLLDLVNQGFLHLDQIEIFVLDEADRMLDMGFIHDVKRIIKLIPEKRQTLLFSATMPNEIKSLADSILINPVKVEVTPASSTADTINQSLYYVSKQNKKDLLVHLLNDRSIETALVFTRTKHGADKLVKHLVSCGISAQAIHGNKSQNARQNALENFKNRKTRVLVATDIAARGIDVDELSHVINYEIPEVPETYVHRIGRTGRAGLSGVSYTFCEEEETSDLRDIHHLIGKTIPVVEDHPFHEVYKGITKRPPKAARPPRNSSSSKRSHSSSKGSSNNKNRRRY
ncbi:MAG: DEAD/DEAH box helicase [Chitinophagaceae bacterium]|nr:MAG: DEAD/DEAH box helicase [Chitinophagaceae bacterium]